MSSKSKQERHEERHLKERCFYCEFPVSRDQLQYDHFPTPVRHGGIEVVPVCKNCHKLKDTVLLHNWPVGFVMEAMKEAGPKGKLLLAKWSNLVVDLYHKDDEGLLGDRIDLEIEIGKKVDAATTKFLRCIEDEVQS